MLLAVPLLFPPTTNLYDPKAETPTTIALPAIWQSFPAFYAFWTWLFLGQLPPTKVYVFLAAGLGAYVFASSIGWIIVGFKGGDDAG